MSMHIVKTVLNEDLAHLDAVEWTREVCHRNHTQHIVSAATHLPDHELVQAKRVHQHVKSP